MGEVWWEGSGKSGERGRHRRLEHNSGERQEGKGMRLGRKLVRPLMEVTMDSGVGKLKRNSLIR